MITKKTGDGVCLRVGSKTAFDDELEERNLAIAVQRTLKVKMAHDHKQASAIPETKLDL
jgi:hypothetical protein